MNFIARGLSVAAVIGTTVVGIGGYHIQKMVDRQSALVEIRRAAYREYLATLIELADNNSDMVRTKYNAKRLELTAVASDEVVRKIGNFNNYMNKTKVRDGKEIKKLVVDIVYAMRRDCFENSTISPQEFANFVPLEG